MKYYHATTEETAEKIFTDGAIRKSWDGCVYLCKTAVDACKFLVLRGIERMIVIEVELDENKVEESHDHNEHFFSAKRTYITATSRSPEQNPHGNIHLIFSRNGQQLPVRMG